MAATAPAAAAAANQAPGQGRRRHPQRGGAGPTPAAGPSRVAAGKEPGPLRSFLSPARGTALPSPARRGRARARAPAPRGMGRPGLTRPRGRPGCRSQAIGGKGEEALGSPPAAGAPDVLEETATRRGGCDPGTEAPAGAARSAAGGGAARKADAAAAPAAEGDAPLPPAARLGAHPGGCGPHARFPCPVFSAQPPHRPSAARGQHPRVPRPRPAPAPRVFQGHLRARGATRPSHSPVR